MKVREFIDFIKPEHDRTSCSDDNISNGFYFEDEEETVSVKYHYRCTRCALLQIENGTVKITDPNIKIIPETIFH